ncbi:MAG: DHH family phosphoesterase [Anaerolineales bacterium]|nr:DHH family phosphoesterase [Anaerolineales bacterium]
MTSELDETIKRRLQRAERVLVTAHIRPDGDAIGSVLALGLALKDAGKQVQMVLPDSLPTSFRHLAGSELIKQQVEGEIDTFVVLDSGDFERVHKQLHRYDLPDVNIDHHITNDNYATLNLVDVDAVSTTSILTEHLPNWGLAITSPIAAALLTGLLTDTMGFRTSSIKPKAFLQAAALMEEGVDLPDLYYRALVSRSFRAARYWGEGLSRLERDGVMVWGVLTLADRKVAGYHGNDDADLINMIASIEKHPVALIFVEQSPELVKVSWRVRGKMYDVAQIATCFGGGGHRAAAGAMIAGSLNEIKPKVLRVTREMLNL